MARCCRRVPSECPSEVRDVILRCLEPNPADRPTAVQLLEWLQQAPGHAPGTPQPQQPQPQQLTLQGYVAPCYPGGRHSLSAHVLCVLCGQ